MGISKLYSTCWDPFTGPACGLGLHTFAKVSGTCLISLCTSLRGLDSARSDELRAVRSDGAYESSSEQVPGGLPTKILFDVHAVVLCQQPSLRLSTSLARR